MRVGVAGACCSRSGKTAVAEALLRACPPASWAAVKFTTTEDVFERCPRGAPCIVCDIDVPFRIVTDAATLREAGTDTDRLAAAGAGEVVWTIAKQAGVDDAWRATEERLKGRPSVIEGSTIVTRAAPDLLLFVVHPFLSPTRWKPTSGPLLTRADLVVLNRPAEEPRAPRADVLAAIAAFRPVSEVRIADVTQPLGAWAPDLLQRLTK